MGRGVGSQAVAIRVARLYVLTWISAWCGVFLGFHQSSSLHIYIISCHVYEVPSSLETFTTDFIGTGTGQLKSNHLQHVVPLLPFVSSKSGHICPIP
jgi:hypothetical protein